MIISKEVEIKINASNFKHYYNYYNDIKVGNKLTIPIKHLHKNSKSKILVKCDICGKEKELPYDMYNKNIKNGNKYACSRKCANFKCIKTCLDKYGVDNPSKNNEIKNKIKDTFLKKYGKCCGFQVKEIKDKIKDTIRKKYGVDYPQQNKEILQKSYATNIKKYGHHRSSMSSDIKNKISIGIKTFYDKESFNIYNNLINKKGDILTIKCEKGHLYQTTKNLYSNRKMLKMQQCTVCHPINDNSSSYEKDIKIIIKSKIDIIEKDRKQIPPYELDIYIPELKLAFEFNGLYWHNELYKDKKYHLNKTELCEKQGIRLIHIYEDNWIYKQDIVKSMILNKLRKTPNKIFARKTEVKEINDNKLVREFLNKNHIQGFIGSKIKLGLFHSGNLVSLMSFGKNKKKSKEGEYELLRFCSKLNTNVVGGANKLFKYFVKNYEPKTITTYADRSWSTGNLYKTLGFSFEGKTEPNYYYIINKKRHHKFRFRKDVLIKEGFDPLKTEHQIMLDRKIYRIFDSGNLKFSYRITPPSE